MDTNTAKQDWATYVASETARIEPTLRAWGIVLESEQPHVIGERYLTGPLGSGSKILLLGRQGARRVVIKASSDPAGTRDIEHERVCRRVLHEMQFAYNTFFSPQELHYARVGSTAIVVNEFIEQERPFLERPLKEQFVLALRAFKAQEGAHATTASHIRVVKHTFGEMETSRYLTKAKAYAEDNEVSRRALKFLERNQETIAQYGGFLTHWDFTPQNIRVVDDKIYLLDHSSLHFGNKYEGWARFINFMELYNPPLARALVQYVRDNRTPEETLSLRLMRVYRLLELIRYYHTWRIRAGEKDRALAEARIDFWSEVLAAVLDEKEVEREVVEEYKKIRDALRSEDEKKRQIGLH